MAVEDDLVDEVGDVVEAVGEEGAGEESLKIKKYVGTSLMLCYLDDFIFIWFFVVVDSCD